MLADLAEDVPLLGVVDDLQWFDQGSAEALLFAARRFEADPIALLFAVRETSMPFETPGVEVLQLAGLAVSYAARVLDSHAPELADPLQARVLEESAGNPLCSGSPSVWMAGSWAELCSVSRTGVCGSARTWSGCPSPRCGNSDWSPWRSQVCSGPRQSWTTASTSRRSRRRCRLAELSW